MRRWFVQKRKVGRGGRRIEKWGRKEPADPVNPSLLSQGDGEQRGFVGDGEEGAWVVEEALVGGSTY